MADTTSPLPELPATERDRFEAWAKSLHIDLRVNFDHHYLHPAVQCLWNGWQAALAAARPAQQAQEAVVSITVFEGSNRWKTYGFTSEVNFKHLALGEHKLYASPQAAQAAQPPQQVQEDAYVPEELRDGIVACLRDDAASLREENDEDERAANMEQAADLIEHLRAELVEVIALGAQQPAAPEGMVLVPREPTPAMLDAMRQCSSLTNTTTHCRDAYMAAISAFPSAPKAEQQGEAHGR